MRGGGQAGGDGAIRGRVVWKDGHRPSELVYERLVDSEERRVSHVEIGGVGYYPDDFQLEYLMSGGVIVGCIVDGLRFTREWPREESCEVTD